MSEASTAAPPAPPAPLQHRYPPDPLKPVIMGGTINLLAAAPGTGKSTLLAWLSRQVHERTPLFGREWGEIPYQAIICADRSWNRSTKLWFDLEGMGEIPAYSLQDDVGFKKSRLRRRGERIQIFEDCLDKLAEHAPGGELPLGSLIYVDPLALFLGGNLLDYDSCLVACSELRELALEKGITIIGTAHAAKQKADKQSRYLRLQDRILGSAALFGYTDTQMYLAAPDEVDRKDYVFLWCPHHAPTATFSFTRGEDGRFSPQGVIDDIQGQKLTKQKPPEIPPPDWLLELLEARPHTFPELIQIATEQHETSRATLHRRLQVGVKSGQIEKLGKGSYQRVKH